MPFGACLLPAGGARFRLWAPGARRVDLCLAEAAPLPMRALEGGWHECVVAAARAGQRYAFRIDGDLQVPDPASRCNADGVHGPSVLVDPRAHAWRDADWRGRPWHEAVVYELHVGTFTPQGTFVAAIERLDDLVQLGVTALELMPVAAFSGRRNWGYDGVLLFAPDASYGTPDELKALVDAAHARGLMVLLDVVYNHFGPDGNYLHVYAAPFFRAGAHTPWGAAIDFDGPLSRTVRDFYLHNALFWLTEYHLDGLRLDAVHAIADTAWPHIVEEIAHAVRRGPGRWRHVHLVVENDRNQTRFLARDAQGAPLVAAAQWNDDAHHAAHLLATGERNGHYADYADRPLWCLARALAEGFAYQGEPSGYRAGAPRGDASRHLPPPAFVDFLQNHDQVGNRPGGERIAQIADEQALRALVACMLLAPAVPLLFMGEEFAASAPFLFFCDFAGELGAAVSHGRRDGFARFGWPAARERVPEPNDEATFERCRLDWAERERGVHARWLALYTHLLKLRRERLLPLLAKARSGAFQVQGPGLLAVSWPIDPGAVDRRLHLLANLCAVPARCAGLPGGDVLYDSHPPDAPRAPWSVRVSIEAAEAWPRCYTARRGHSTRTSSQVARPGSMALATRARPDLTPARAPDRALQTSRRRRRSLDPADRHP
jgi:malto-oligosyltrehalose trehalohydrolase